MYEHNALGCWSGLALCLTKVRSSRARCPATALIVFSRRKKEMPPKPLPEKSYVILKNHKYFEALTLIVRIQSQEDQQSLMMTLKLNESGYFKLY